MTYLLTFLLAFILGFFSGKLHEEILQKTFFIWECTCTHKNKCKFFGTFDQAADIAIDCKNADDEFTLIRSFIDIDNKIQDVSKK